MGNGTLSAAIADILSTAIQTLTLDEIAGAAERKLGYNPSRATVSRVVGQRGDWRKITIDGKIAFTRRR